MRLRFEIAHNKEIYSDTLVNYLHTLTFIINFVAIINIMKITIAKKKGNQHTLRCIDTGDLAEMIREAKYEKEVVRLRSDYVILNHIRKTNEGIKLPPPEDVVNIPSLFFSAEYKNLEGNVVTESYNPLFLIEINDLTGYQEVEELRAMAAELPQTMIAFMGASGRSLKIVCSARCAKDYDEMSADEMLLLIQAAYDKASKYYAAQLDIPIDIKIPSFSSGCKMSVDRDIYYNPDSEAFFVRDFSKNNAPTKRYQEKEDVELMPGYDLRQTQRAQFENYLGQIIEENIILDGEDLVEAVLPKLAKYCYEDRLPKEMCITRTLSHSDFGRDEHYVRTVFNNEYKKELIAGSTLRHVTPEILLSLKMQRFMQDRFEMRRNVLSGVVEYRKRDGKVREFENLTDYAINSMTQDALEEGLKSWDKDVRRYVNSDKIEKFDPVNHYLDNLPDWDGIDYISELAARVPNDNPDWVKNFHIWMLSMVAHWKEEDKTHGNAYSPLLIGPQGCGKSSFCKKILPPELMSYYYDRIDFKNEQSADLALTRFALINIDEFDQLSPNRQAILKYLLQKSEVKTRRPYGTAIEEMQRYASFIATTNNISPLSDPTGSRRFICIMVSGDIDYNTPINYEQLYAQALAEIRKKEKFWFNDDETAEIMKQNEDFRIEDGLTVMINTFFRPAKKMEEGEWLSLAEILATLRTHFKNLKDDIGTLQKLGTRMKAHFEQKRPGGRIRYHVINMRKTTSTGCEKQ